VFGADRKFTTLNEFQVPSSSNIEGFAITPALKANNTLGDQWCFLTDDNNLDGALRWFKQLPSPLTINAGNTQTAIMSTAVPTGLSIERLTPAQAVTNAASVTWRVTCSEHVNGVSPADFMLVDVNNSLTGESVTGVSAAAGSVIDVTANTGSGSGVLRLDVRG